MAKSRALLWGTMRVGAAKRRFYLFRIEPQGVLAIRVGFPLAWFALFGSVVLFYVTLSTTILGVGAIIAGAAVGLAAMGLLNRAIALGVATQTRERVLASAMNLYFETSQMGEVQFQESASRTYLRWRWRDATVEARIDRPAPPEARRLLASGLQIEGP